MKEKFIEFYINKFNYLDSSDNIDVSFLSPIVRRRLSKLDKGVIYLLNKTVCDDTKNIIFSSQTGEFDRLMKIIEQYSTEKEVSPNTFSGSVHNYPVGFFLLNHKKPIPYNALSAGDNSVSAGLEAAVISKDNTLFCYADIYGGNLITFAVSLTKVGDNKNKYMLIIKNNTEINDTFENYIKFFNGKINIINSSLFTVERVKND